jgi:hypothetical protein
MVKGGGRSSFLIGAASAAAATARVVGSLQGQQQQQQRQHQQELQEALVLLGETAFEVFLAAPAEAPSPMTAGVPFSSSSSSSSFSSSSEDDDHDSDSTSTLSPLEQQQQWHQQLKQQQQQRLYNSRAVLLTDRVSQLNNDGAVAAAQRSIDVAVAAAHEQVRLFSPNQDMAEVLPRGDVTGEEKGLLATSRLFEGSLKEAPEARVARVRSMGSKTPVSDMHRTFVRMPAAIRVSSRNSISILEQPLFPDIEWVQYAAERFSDVRQLHYRLCESSSSDGNHSSSSSSSGDSGSSGHSGSSDWAKKLAELLPEAVQTAEAVIDGGLLFGSGRATAYRRLTSSSSSSSSRGALQGYFLGPVFMDASDPQLVDVQMGPCPDSGKEMLLGTTVTVNMDEKDIDKKREPGSLVFR